MRKMVTGLAASMLLVACGGESGTIETEDGDVEYDVDRGDGSSEFRITTDDGEEMVINTDVDADADMPEGFSLYPGADVVRNMTMRQNDGEVTSIVLNSSASPAEVTAFYRRQAEAAGVAISVEMTNGDTRMISGTDDAGRMFSFTATPGGDGTTANLSVGRDLE